MQAIEFGLAVLVGVLAIVAIALYAYRRGARQGRAREAALTGRLAELESANTRLRHAERLAGIGEYDWNVETGALWWSENCYRLYGIDPAGGISIERAFGAIHPDDAELARTSTDALLAGGPLTEHKLRIVRPDGSVRSMLSGGEVYRDGGQLHVFGVMKDVTDLADADARLARAEAQYRFLFEHNPLPMWVFDRETLRFLAVNDAMLRHYGYAREELLAQSLEFMHPPDEAEAVRAAVRWESAERPQGRVWTHLRKDGRRVRTAIYPHDIEFCGRPARLVAAQDVTERERNEQRFRLIARATSDAVYDYDIEHGRLWWGESFYALFGYSAETLSPTLDAWAELLHPDDAVWTSASFAAALESPEADEWTAEYRLRRSDGRYAQVLERGLFSRNSEGRAVRMVGGLLDVTEQRRSEADLRLLRRAVEAAYNGVVIADAREPDLPIVYVNRAAEAMTGYSASEMLGRNCRFLQGDDRDQPGIDAIRQALLEAREARVLVRNYRKDGTLFWNDFQIAPVRNERGTLTHFLGVFNDVSERQRYEEQLAHRATHDELTGLPNRLLLDDRLQQAILGSQRYGRGTTVVFIDLDDFKLVNDSLGHTAGDAALREVARRLEGVVRDTDTVSRFGGDEFVAVLTEQSSANGTLEVIRRISAALAQPIALGEVSHTLTASIGYCAYPQDGEDPETLLRHADLAMYQAKRHGRNRAMPYREEFDASVAHRLQLLNQLRDALERREFVLAFQPLFAPDGRPVALEALVRWQHPTRGLLLPGEFIGICEESGLIVELGRRILREAARHYALLVEAGLGELRIAVNVSAAQFTDELFTDIESTLQEFTLPHGVLEIELTESVIMESPTRAIELMQRLAALGVSFSVDDFGTGYSSLAYLKRFPIDRLKIDRSFVQDLGVDDDDAAICQSIIGLAHSLDIRTVAEGIETEQQLAWLQARGCDELQGYLLGRPQPFETVLALLRRSHGSAAG
ncbi:EAL domain-containing protein [Lysobacter korlensis]|uniref:EAL domain-containing protein n=1 Tax=Lysobacter korlensis TaxID=553636 RepID=A0ABV6RHT5_9GAMM